jgi:4-carboxymuconolactone decarboxylase
VQDRLPPLAHEQLTDEQRAAVVRFESGPRGTIFGPFSILLRSPEVLDHAQKLGEYLRFKSIVPKKLREFAILIAGRECWQPFIWYVHEPIARESGLSDEIVRALADGRRPRTMDEDESAVYEFCGELFRNKMVSDATYEDALTRFGEQGIIDLVGISAYWSLLGMAMNVSQMPLPSDADSKLTRFLKRAV